MNDTKELITMFIFGKERQSLRIKKARAARAIFVNTETQEVEVQLLTDDGERLELQIPSSVAHTLIMHMTEAYLAINPPLRTGAAADWQGMMD